MPDKSMQVLTAYSPSVDPCRNLALEEYLLNTVGEGQVLLYLWQNDHTVVIGRNQNPWKECRCAMLENNGGKLVRRMSGGGAVYHDLGNLNFTFIADKKSYDLDKQVRVVLDAVRRLGIPAEFSGRNDLTAHGRKFSGNAFFETEDAALHHGTILVSCSIDNLEDYLQVSAGKIKSKGIDSVRSRVVNLAELNPAVGISDVAGCLLESFQKAYAGSCPIEIEQIDDDRLEQLYAKYASWQWNYGQAPDFDIQCEHRFPWGSIDLGLKIEDGHIHTAVVYSDAMNSALIGEIARALRLSPFKRDEMSRRLNAIEPPESDRMIIQDLDAWLGTIFAK